MKVVKHAVVYLFLVSVCLLCVAPFVYALYNSFLSMADVDHIVPLSHFSFRNYVTLFTKYSVWRWIKNTIVMTVIIVAGNIVIATMAGYALAHFHFAGRQIIHGMVIITLMVPFQILITPIYLQVVNMGWNNTMKSITVPFLAQTMYVFLAKQYFETFPFELEEAARVDGITRIGFFGRIAVPLSKPLLTTIIILSFTGTWNSYFVPSTLITDQSMYPLVVGLNTVKARYFAQPNLSMAGVVLLTLPVLVIYIFCQKWFIQGVAMSGIKE